MQSKTPTATVTFTGSHPDIFNHLFWQRYFWHKKQSCPLKASVIQNIYQVCLTSGISLSKSSGLRKGASGWGTLARYCSETQTPTPNRVGVVRQTSTFHSKGCPLLKPAFVINLKYSVILKRSSCCFFYSRVTNDDCANTFEVSEKCLRKWRYISISRHFFLLLFFFFFYKKVVFEDSVFLKVFLPLILL